MCAEGKRHTVCLAVIKYSWSEGGPEAKWEEVREEAAARCRHGGQYEIWRPVTGIWDIRDQGTLVLADWGIA